MSKVCDHKSVGVLIENEAGDLLLIERKKFPFGFAPPAGHVDDFPTSEAAALGEVKEEVGLEVTELELIHEELRKNPCRRKGGDHHYWWIYKAKTTGEIIGSDEETKQVTWCNREEVGELAERTQRYQAGEISETDWESAPGLEPVWYNFLKLLKLI